MKLLKKENNMCQQNHQFNSHKYTKYLWFFFVFLSITYENVSKNSSKNDEFFGFIAKGFPKKNQKNKKHILSFASFLYNHHLMLWSLPSVAISPK